MMETKTITSDGRSPSPYDLVKYHLVHPATLCHDFSKCELCSVPVRIVLQNCSGEDVWVKVDLLPSVQRYVRQDG